MDKKELLMHLSAADFTALDLQLYLDTHPCDKTAIGRYNAAVADAAKLRGEYEARYGRLLSYIMPSMPDRFDWIDDPWPWEKGFAEE